jgi:hypothetical protein
LCDETHHKYPDPLGIFMIIALAGIAEEYLYAFPRIN